MDPRNLATRRLPVTNPSLERCIVDLLSRMSLLAAKLTQVTHESN
jgi:hypothetical protein